MLFSRWTLLQVIILILLGMLPFGADIFNEDIAVMMGDRAVQTVQPMLLTIGFLVFVLGGFHLLLYFQTKKSTTFLSHPAWNKMYVLFLIIFIASIVFFIVGVTMIPLDGILQAQRWGFYLILYYFLFVFTLLVLSFIHKVNQHSMSNDRKIGVSFIVSLLILVCTIFIF